MKEEDQILAAAELDGWHSIEDSGNALMVSWPVLSGHPPSGAIVGKKQPLKKYTSSFDAIIPLIQKQPYGVRNDVSYYMKGTVLNSPDFYMATPSQLCEALLRATGKWKA